MPHACPELLAEAVYGLPEVNRAQIKKARLVANPGCYPTAVQLGFLPLVEQGLVDSPASDCRCQVRRVRRRAQGRGAHAVRRGGGQFQGLRCGRAPPSAGNSTRSGSAAGKAVGLTFVPHLTPMIRGIHATLYARVNDTRVDLQETLRAALCERTIRRCAAAGQSPGYALGARCQHLSYRAAPSTGRRHGGDSVGHRQSGERRRRSGGAEHEPDVRSAGSDRTRAGAGVALSVRWFVSSAIVILCPPFSK